jgi:hypothetical protein
MAILEKPMRVTIAGSLFLAAAALSTAPAAGQDDGLYARVDRRLAADPALAEALGQPAPEMAEAAWLIGEWEIDAAVTGKEADAAHGTALVSPLYGGVWLEMRDTYPDGNQDLGYLGFNPATRRWTSVSLDSYGNANVATSDGWHDGCIAFEGDFIVIGETAHLRQTLCRAGADGFRIDNAELVGGEWRAVDAYVYRRKGAG